MAKQYCACRPTGRSSGGGQGFIPGSSQNMSGAGVNALTLNVYDPVSKKPEFKHCAVQVEKVDLPWQMGSRRGDAVTAAWLCSLIWHALPMPLPACSAATTGSDPAYRL